MADPNPPSALLLLPPPSAFSFDPVKDAFEPSLADVYTKLSDKLNESNDTAILDIALAIPGLLSSCQPRAKVFAQLQHYLSSVYTLIGAVCATRNIELDSPGGIDTRVVFVDQATKPAERTPFGPILDLQSLADCDRRWDHVYYLGNTAGKNVADSFISHVGAQAKDGRAASLQAITSHPDWTTADPLLSPNDQPSTPYYSVVVGGTFDHLHVGHKLLLTAVALALEPGREGRLTIGVTGDALLTKKKYAEVLESWEERWQSTASFLRAIMDFSPGEKSLQIERGFSPDPNGQTPLKNVLTRIQPNLAFKFVEISEMFGPTITEENLGAIVVSKETRSGGALINDERAKKGWKALAVFEVDVLQSGEATDTESFESKISSTDIRRRRAHRSKV
jgi:phosphopantetheine adenylyltransferase